MPGAAYLSKFKMSTIDADAQQSGSGITELERAFGSAEKCNQLMNAVDASKLINSATTDRPSEKHQVIDDDSCSESSDVDCEELDGA